MKLCKWLFVGFGILLFGIVFLYLLVGHVLGVGFYDLTVYIHCDDELPRKVACCPMRSRNEADHYCELSQSPEFFGGEGGDSMLVKDYLGEPIRMSLMFDEDSNLFRTKYYHSRFLIVCAEWANGKQMCKVVEIPEMQ